MASSIFSDEDRPSTSSEQNINDSDDPIVATYKVFFKPKMPDDRELLILQYMARVSQDPQSLRLPRVLELRNKPQTGVVEVDLPIDASSPAYDQAKGMKWGKVLQDTMEAKKGGSLGLAGGFGVGAAVSRGPSGRRGANDENPPPLSFQEALRQEKVLRTQTLVGTRTSAGPTNYMIGAFQGNNIHLTPVSSFVQLRPHARHIDAAAEQEKLSRPAPAGAAGADKNTGRAIHMTLKAAMDDGGVTAETMGDRLRSVQSEPFRQMEWFHDETEAAWAAYQENLLIHPRDAPSTEASEGKGKQPATEISGESNTASDPKLVEKVAWFTTDWTEENYLRKMHKIGPNDPKPGEEAVTEAVQTKALSSKGKGKAPVPSSSTQESERAGEPEEPQKRPGRSAKGATTASAAVPKRGGRARSSGRGTGSGPPDAMQID